MANVVITGSSTGTNIPGMLISARIARRFFDAYVLRRKRDLFTHYGL